MNRWAIFFRPPGCRGRYSIENSEEPSVHSLRLDAEELCLVGAVVNAVGGGSDFVWSFYLGLRGALHPRLSHRGLSALSLVVAGIARRLSWLWAVSALRTFRAQGVGGAWVGAGFQIEYGSFPQGERPDLVFYGVLPPGEDHKFPNMDILPAEKGFADSIMAFVPRENVLIWDFGAVVFGENGHIWTFSAVLPGENGVVVPFPGFVGGATGLGN